MGEAGGSGGAPAFLARSWRRVLRDRVLGWFEAGARRESRPGDNLLGLCRGWDGVRLPRAGLEDTAVAGA